MSKRTIRHYLNKRLQAKMNQNNIKTFSLYCELIYNKKSYQFRSKTASIYITEVDFKNINSNKHSKGYRLLKKDLEIIEFCAEHCTDKKGIFKFSKFIVLYEKYSVMLIEIIKDYTYFIYENAFSVESISEISLSSKLKELKKHPIIKNSNIIEAKDLLLINGNYHSPLQLLISYFSNILIDPNKDLTFFVIDWMEGNIQDEFKQFLSDSKISENEQKCCLLLINKILNHFLKYF